MFEVNYSTLFAFTSSRKAYGTYRPAPCSKLYSIYVMTLHICYDIANKANGRQLVLHIAVFLQLKNNSALLTSSAMHRRVSPPASPARLVHNAHSKVGAVAILQ